jgi:polysaccharide export outer membrane protein
MMHNAGFLFAALFRGLHRMSLRLPVLLAACLLLPAALSVAAADPAPGQPKARESQRAGPGAPMDELPGLATSGSSAVVLREDDYLIGPADELDIEVFMVEELSGTEKVNSRGYIRMPLIGPVKVAGLSAEQAEDLLVEIYGRDYLNNPQINIDVVKYASQQVTLLGAVEKPGVYALQGRTTLLQAVAMAGGTGRLADLEEIVVFRTRRDGGVVGYLVNMEEITSGQKEDPEVIGNDRIVIPESGSKSFVKGITDTLRGFIGFRPY